MLAVVKDGVTKKRSYEMLVKRQILAQEALQELQTMVVLADLTTLNLVMSHQCISIAIKIHPSKEDNLNK